MNKLAQVNFTDIMDDGFDGDASQSIFSKYPDLDLGKIISLLLPYLFAISGIALLFYLIFGGFTMMTSSGDPKKVQEGQHIITNALIGFVIIFAAFWLVYLLGSVLGLDPIIDTFTR